MRPCLTHFNLNTSNKHKLKEFQRLFSSYNINFSHTMMDLREIDADPISVITHKATTLGDHNLVEDTSLEVEGHHIGVNIRWLLEHLDQHIGCKAIWVVLLEIKKDNLVEIFEGKIHGSIVPASNFKGFGFDPFFLPGGQSKTLSQSKPNSVNARALAVDNFVKNNIYKVTAPIFEWNGKWQQKNPRSDHTK